MASDNESNVSGFIRCNDQNIMQLYLSAIEITLNSLGNALAEFHSDKVAGKSYLLNKNMESINQDLLQVENNLKRIAEQSGPLESHLRALLRTLPQPNLQLNMETD